MHKQGRLNRSIDGRRVVTIPPMQNSSLPLFCLAAPAATTVTSAQLRAQQIALLCSPIKRTLTNQISQLLLLLLSLRLDGPMTVFVPSNEALRKIPDEELDVIKNNNTALKGKCPAPMRQLSSDNYFHPITRRNVKGIRKFDREVQPMRFLRLCPCLPQPFVVVCSSLLVNYSPNRAESDQTNSFS